MLVAAIAALLLAILLLQPVRWASSGDIELPVRVLIFDATTGKSIEGARVWILRAPAVFEDQVPEDLIGWIKELELPPQGEQPASVNQHPFIVQGITASEGVATLRHKFTTGASDRSPEGWVHLHRAWVVVKSPKHGGVVLPIRFAPERRPAVKQAGEVLVTVGLFPIDMAKAELSLEKE
ncbi:MAG: hypothetical protein C0478_06460 [Planctomyces sp.]|nr:hypothetical protein [Planctomyces sp.]